MFLNFNVLPSWEQAEAVMAHPGTTRDLYEHVWLFQIIFRSETRIGRLNTILLVLKVFKDGTRTLIGYYTFNRKVRNTRSVDTVRQ